MAGVIPGSLENGGAKILYPYTIDTATLTASSVAESDYPVWASGTTYAAAARVIRLTNHRVYERVAAGAGTIVPEADVYNWVEIGATNRWRMFDLSVGSVTSVASPLSVSLSLGPVNDAVLLNVTGTSVTITKPGGATITQAVPAPAVAGEGSTVVFTGIAGTTGVYTVALTGSGTVSIGSLCMGAFISLGSCDYGASVGLTDFSSKSTDAYGSVSLVTRDYQHKLGLPVTVAAANLDQTVNILAAVRSIPVVWVGVQALGSTIVFGYARDWSFKVDNTAIASGSINIDGLAVGSLPPTGA